MKLTELMSPRCVEKRSVQHGACSGLMISPMHEGTRGRQGGRFNLCAEESLGCPLQAFNGDNSSLFRGCRSIAAPRRSLKPLRSSGCYKPAPC